MEILPPLGSTPPPRDEMVREIVEVLRSEMAIVTGHCWEELPDLKRRKVVLASRLCSPPPGSDANAAPENSLIRDLEAHSTRQIRVQMDIIGRQIFALQELRQYWAECLSVSFTKYY